MKLTRKTGTILGGTMASIAALLLASTLISGERGPSPAAQAPAPTGSSGAPSPAPSYSRDLFGPRWADVDRNGCDTRNDILKRDLVDVVVEPGTHDCVVLSGTLHDPLTGETVAFVRKSGGYQPVQIDHIVPLAVAWSSGTASWSLERRIEFANDPANLETTTANQAKGDSTPSEWMPVSSAAACTYSKRYLAVISTYALEISAADSNALEVALQHCPSSR